MVLLFTLGSLHFIFKAEMCPFTQEKLKAYSEYGIAMTKHGCSMVMALYISPINRRLFFNVSMEDLFVNMINNMINKI